MAAINVTVQDGTTIAIVREDTDAAIAAAQTAAASAIIAQAFTGPLYDSIALGLAATSDQDGFAVDNEDGTAGVYLNNAGTAVLIRTIIIDPSNPGTAALIGTTGGDLQSVLDGMGGGGTLAISGGGTGATTAAGARTNLGVAASGAIGSSGLTMATARLLGRTTAGTGAVEAISIGSGLTLSAGTLTATGGGTGTVTSVSGTGTVNGITLTGTVTNSGNLTLGGTLSGVSLTTQVTGTLPIANGGTGATSAANARTALGAAASGANTDITALDQDVTITATGTIAANSIGFRGLPVNAQTTGYTLALSDQGRMVTITGGVAIPGNGSIAFPVGASVVVYNNSASAQTVSITTDTLRLAGTASTGTRTLAARGFATLVKVAATEWVVTGNVT